MFVYQQDRFSVYKLYVLKKKVGGGRVTAYWTSISHYDLVRQLGEGMNINGLADTIKVYI